MFSLIVNCISLHFNENENNRIYYEMRYLLSIYTPFILGTKSLLKEKSDVFINLLF